MGAVKNIKKTKKIPRKTAKKTSKRPARLNARRTFAIYAVLVVLAAISAVAAAQASRQDVQIQPDPFITSQQKAAGFRYYYPAQLPKGYRLDTASIDYTTPAILNFTLFDPNGASLNVTEQKVPANFNFGSFYEAFGGRTSWKSPLGTVTNGAIDDGKTQLTSLVTGDGTWILMSSKHTLPQADLKRIFAQLKTSM